MKTTVVKLAMAALAVYAVICIPSCTKPDNSGETDKPTNPTIPEGVVDLGLSVYWATMNLGATAPEGYGDYYAWAEIEPYYTQGHAQDEVCSDWRTGKTGYNWASYQWCNGGPAATKYCTNEYVGTPDGRTVILPEDDAATFVLKGAWRMPTSADFDELNDLSKCSWERATVNDVYGFKVVSKIPGYEGNYIFLPCAGYREEAVLKEAKKLGEYWTSTLFVPDGIRPNDMESQGTAYVEGFGYISNSSGQIGSWHRIHGCNIRPVCVKE